MMQRITAAIALLAMMMFILKRWIENPQLTASRMCEILQEEGFIKNGDRISVEMVRQAVKSVNYNFLRRRLKRLIEKGKSSWRESGVIEALGDRACETGGYKFPRHREK